MYKEYLKANLDKTPNSKEEFVELFEKIIIGFGISCFDKNNHFKQMEDFVDELSSAYVSYLRSIDQFSIGKRRRNN